MLQTDFFVIDSFRNLISCLFSFEIGMLIIKHFNLMQRKYVFVISFFLLLVVCFFQIPFGNSIGNHLFGLLFFAVLYRSGNRIMKVNWLNLCIKEISNISFEIFLLQHIIVYAVLDFKNPAETWKSLVLIVIIVVMAIIAAKGLHIIVSAFVTGKYYLLFERCLYTKFIK